MKTQFSDIEKAKAETKGIYERQAVTWDRQRPKVLYEKSWLDRFADKIVPGGTLLDLGCGSGDPIAGYFLAKGFRIVGVDFAKSMIELAQTRYPKADWYVQDIRALDIIDKFDGVYSWDGFFHLSVEEQRAAIPILASYVKPEGTMLLTVGTSEGEVTGTVGGETVYHASLSADEYKMLMKENGFDKIEYVPEDSKTLGRSVLLASQKLVT